MLQAVPLRCMFLIWTHWYMVGRPARRRDLRAVVIIEDDHELRVSLRQTFESHGFHVYSAATAIEGMATLSRVEDACLILLSTSIKLLSYEDFLKQKNEDIAKRSVPVVLL